MIETTSPKIDLAALMRSAVQVARSLKAGGKDWRWKMSVALRSAWRTAKAAVEADQQRDVIAELTTVADAIPGRPDTRRLILDRSQALAVLARIQRCPINRGRELVSAASGLPDLDDILHVARREYRALPDADRNAIRASLTAVPPPHRAEPYRPARRRSTAYLRGSRVSSHGW